MGTGGSGPATEDRADETWIVDRPSDNIELDLTRHHRDGKRSLDSTGMHLISKGTTPPSGIGLCTADGRSYYDALGEVVKGADSGTFDKFGRMDGGVFEVKPPASISACGGAARIHVDGLGHRWIFPTGDGHYTWAALEETLRSTSDRDDWNTLRDGYLNQATEQERTVVADHFRGVEDTELQAEVAGFFE